MGILGIKALLNALSEYGYTDIAYKTVNRYDYPSYGYWKEQGATTLWERWDGKDSHNHHMYGDVLHWFARNIAGVQNVGVAYDRCVLRPYFFAQICSANASTRTPYGEISFSWEKQGNVFKANVIVPTGVCAKLILGEKEKTLIAGSYEIRETIE